MKVLIDVKDSKAEFVMELLDNLPFVKAKPISPQKVQLIEEIKESVDNPNLVKKGKLKARPAKELVNEL